MFTVSKSRHAQLVLLAVVVFSFSIYWFAPISKSAFPSYLNNAVSTPGFKATPPHIEVEGFAMGKPFDVREKNLTRDEDLQVLTEALLARFLEMNVNVAHPECSIDRPRFDSILSAPHLLSSETSRRVSLALNLYNSEDILPSLSVALLGLVHYLKPHHQVYISIFENDSTDKTLELLGHLAAALVALNIDGLTFRHSMLSTPLSVDRIKGLANLRNEAIFPLFADAANGTILFINDVITCTSDLLELLYQLRLQEAHAVMSTDWFIHDNQPQFRDVWVMRGINGEMPYPYKGPGGYTHVSPSGNWARDLFVNQDAALHTRWLDGRTVPVYSGWNGAMACDAKLFTEYHMRFRASGLAHWTGGDPGGSLGKWGQLIATPGYLDSDCSASECKLFARDLWNLEHGHARILVASQSKTGYSLSDWDIISSQLPVTRRTGPEDSEELINWANVTMPEEVVCVPSLDKDGKQINLWADDNFRIKMRPLFPGWTG